MSRRDRVSILKSLAGVIRRADIAEHVTIIAKAKVPIIKFVTIHGVFWNIYFCCHTRSVNRTDTCRYQC